MGAHTRDGDAFDLVCFVIVLACQRGGVSVTVTKMPSSRGTRFGHLGDHLAYFREIFMRLDPRARLMALPFAAVLGFCVHVAPASAQNAVSQQFNDMKESLGFGETRAPIDFTERPPLVVPPTNTLPPPGNGMSEKLPVVDPDIESRRKALSDSRRPVPPSDPGATATGLSSRAYLIDPPAGLRNPDTVAAEVTTDGGHHSDAAPVRRKHVRKKVSPGTAQQ